jgi:murein hydrolase activator
MRSIVLYMILVLATVAHAAGQSKTELEEQRKKTLEEISYVDNLLKTTSRERSESMNEARMISRKLNLRESVIAGMRQEIGLISERIALNALAVEMMEDDLVALRKDYSKAVVNSYITRKGYPEIMYILSARDFNQGYKRLKYLQQITEFRRNESEIILELKSQIEISRRKLQADLARVSDLKSREEQQKSLLQNEQERQQKIVKSLSNKEQQLKKQLEEKRRVARKIESEIAKLIAEEKNKARSVAETPEQKLIGDSFAENKGRLPWPVEKGVITSRFGIQKNPVLKYVQEENHGIEITGPGKMAARSIFKGEVTRIFPIQGANMTIIIKHGKFYSVYNNIVNVRVKTGQNVETKQYIGDVYADPSDNNNCVLQFMIYDTRYQDPEIWLAKN